MKETVKYGFLTGSALVFLMPDWAPNELLRFGLGSIVGSVTILIGTLFLSSYDKLVGLGGFLAIASLYLEHRRRILERLRRNMYASKKGNVAPIDELTRGSPPTQPNEKHPAHQKPVEEEVDYLPDDTHDNSAADDTGLDGKHPLDTVGQNTEGVAEFFQERGLARI